MEIQPEFSAESDGSQSTWRRVRFWQYIRPVRYSLMLMIIGCFIATLFIWVVRPDLFRISEISVMWGLSIALVLGPLALAWVLAYIIIQPWYRTLPVGIEVDNVLETIEMIAPCMRTDERWAKRLRIDPESDYRLLIPVPSGTKARIYSDKNGSQIHIWMKRWVAGSHRQLFFDFVDEAIERTLKDNIEDRHTEE